MEKLMEAISSGDLVAAKREFGTHMSAVTAAIIAEQKLEISRSVIIEGEEPKDKKDDEDEEDDEDEDEEEDE